MNASVTPLHLFFAEGTRWRGHSFPNSLEIRWRYSRNTAVRSRISTPVGGRCRATSGCLALCRESVLSILPATGEWAATGAVA
jgi:hypothetical protein